MNDAILDLLGGRGGNEPLAFEELVHYLTVLRHDARPEMPAIDRDGVAAALALLTTTGKVQLVQGKWERVYAEDPQRRLF